MNKYREFGRKKKRINALIIFFVLFENNEIIQRGNILNFPMCKEKFEEKNFNMKKKKFFHLLQYLFIFLNYLFMNFKAKNSKNLITNRKKLE